MEWDAHDARLLGARLKDCLANPPHRVRDELDAPRLVELSRRPHQPDVAFVDQVRERDATRLVLLRDRNDEAQVGTDKGIQRLAVAGANATPQLDLLLTAHQRIASDLLEVQRQRIDSFTTAGMAWMPHQTLRRVMGEISSLRPVTESVQHRSWVRECLISLRAAGRPRQSSVP